MTASPAAARSRRCPTRTAARWVPRSCATTSEAQRRPSTSRPTPGPRPRSCALAPRFDVLAENFKPGTIDSPGPRLRRDRAARTRGSSTCRSPASATRRVPVPRLAGVRVDRRVDVGDLRVHAPRERGPPVHDPRRRARRHQLGAVRASSASSPRCGTATRTGEGQYVDVAMFDAMVAMTDIVTNFWSMGVRARARKGLEVDLDGFRARDGYVVMQIVREHQFVRARRPRRPSRVERRPPASRPRGWGRHLETVIRPAVEAWASRRTKLEAARELTAAGIAAGPSQPRADVIADPHVAPRNMLVEMPAHRRRGAAGPDPGQPGEAVEGGRRPRDPRALGRRAHRDVLPRSSTSTTPSSIASPPRASSKGRHERRHRRAQVACSAARRRSAPAGPSACASP